MPKTYLAPAGLNLLNSLDCRNNSVIQSRGMIHLADMWMRIQMWIFFLSLWTGAQGITCLDSAGQHVDWYAMYKLPMIPNSTYPMIEDGLASLYLDRISPSWSFLEDGMTGSRQAVYQTLSPIYSRVSDDMLFIMYNDDETSSGDKITGHSKGVVAFDKGHGFWLIHSAPRFPPGKSKGYDFPNNARYNGQSFLCVTFPYIELGNVARQLWYNELHIYDSNVPHSFIRDYPTLNDVIRKTPPPGSSSVLQLTSLHGQEFISFAKSSHFGADLYDGLVAPILQQNLLVETWTNGAGTKLGSNCTAEYKVMNIKYIDMKAFEVEFKQTVDHTKWAISTSKGFEAEKVLRFQELEKWTCVGDINRMRSQAQRGGGTICLLNPYVWKAYTEIVADYEGC